MTLHKSMWKAAVLMGIAGVLMFAGGAWAAKGAVVTAFTLTSTPNLTTNATANWYDSVSVEKGDNLSIKTTAQTEANNTFTYTLYKASTVPSAVPSASTMGSLSEAKTNVAQASAVSFSVSTSAPGASWFCVRARSSGGTAAADSGDVAVFSSRWVKVRVNPEAPVFTTDLSGVQETNKGKALTLTVARNVTSNNALQWETSAHPIASPAVWTPIQGATAATYSVPVTTVGSKNYRCVSTTTAGGTTAGFQTTASATSGTVRVDVKLYEKNIGDADYKIVITGTGSADGSTLTTGDTIYKGAQVTPRWQLQRGNTVIGDLKWGSGSTPNASINANPTGKQFKVAWGDNIEAGTKVGRIDVTLASITDKGTVDADGFQFGDTLYEGTAGLDFNIAKLTLSASNVAAYINLDAGSLNPEYNGDNQDADIDVTTGKIKGIEESDIGLVYKLKTGSAYGNATQNTADVGTYGVYLLLQNVNNFNNTNGTVKLGDMVVKKADIFTHVSGAPGSPATATVTIDGDYYFNDRKEVVVPPSAVTVALSNGVAVPTGEFTVKVDANGQGGDVNKWVKGDGAKVIVTLKNSKNFETRTTNGTLQGTIDIKPIPIAKRHLTYIKPSGTALTYDGAYKSGTVGVSASGGAAASVVDELVLRFNGEDSTDVVANPFPADSAKYIVTANLKNAVDGFVPADEDIVIDSFVIARVAWTNANLRTFLNLGAAEGTTDPSIEKALDDTKGTGKEIVAGDPDWNSDGRFDVKLATRANTDPAWSGLGAVTLEFSPAKSGAKEKWVEGVPGAAGTYFARIKIAEGANFRALATPFVLNKQLKVIAGDADDSDFEPAENVFVYGRNATYTVKGPTLSGSLGEIDTVIYSNLTAKGSQNGTYKIGTIAAKGASFVLTGTNLNKAGYIDVGSYTVDAKVRASRKENGVVVESWETSTDLELEFEILPRPIDSAGITFTVTSTAAQMVFTGNALKPEITVREGTATLVEKTSSKENDFERGGADLSTDVSADDVNQINAGPAQLVVIGKGNYSGYALVPFTIGKKTVTPVIDKITTANQSRTYDGTTFIDTVQGGDVPFVKIALTGLTTQDASDLKNVEDYIITNASIENANVGTNKKITATIALTDSDRMSNYQLANGAASATITSTGSGGTGVNIVRLNPATDVSKAFDVTAFPVVRYFNDQIQTLNPSPELLPGLSLGGDGAFRILYFPSSAAALKDTVLPKAADTYTVRAYVTGTEANMNITTNKTSNEPLGYALGTFTINPEAKPIFASNSPRDTTVRFGKTVGIKVGAAVPNGSTGTLSYQWFRYASATANDTTGQPVGFGETFNYTAVDSVGSVLFFGVKVINTYDGYQASAYAPRKARVTVLVPPVSMAAATFTIDSAYLATGFTYTGSDIKLDVSKVRVQMPSTTVNDVVVPGAVLVANRDYELKYTNNKNAGTATVVASGLDAYEDATASKAFVINKKTPTIADFTWDVSNAYTAAANGANVKSKDTTATDATLGAVAVKYAGAATVPVKAGQYALTVDVAGGSNFNAAPGLVLGNYTITKAVIDTTWLNYSIPVGHKVGQAAPLGIGAVTMKKGEGVPDSVITVKYNGLATVPSVAGKYNVTADIIGGDNFFSAAGLALGTYEIGVGIASGNTKIPTAPKAAVVTVAPVKVAAASFTAGPSPVSKNGVIKFFSAKQVKSGSLYIFDANGNAVTKLSAKAGSGEIASWNLKDKKGASVAEGTYVVKGALAAKDGTREKVSFVFSVVK